MSCVTSHEFVRDLRTLGYVLPEHLTELSIKAENDRAQMAVFTCAAYMDKATHAPAAELRRKDGPVATIHVDGSFVHVTWHREQLARGSLDVWTRPQAEHREQVMPDVWAKWPDDFMCPIGEVEEALSAPLARSDDFERVEVTAYGSDGSPSRWRPAAPSRSQAEAHLRRAEDHRREAPSLSATPLPGLTDYAPAAQWIASALHHLDEALPAGQRERANAAMEAMVSGVGELKRWMTAKGY